MASGSASGSIALAVGSGNVISVVVTAQDGTTIKTYTTTVTRAANTSYTAPSATGTGNITASFTGGGPGCTYAVAQYIPVTGSGASPPAGSAPAGVIFPQGLFDFSLTGCTPGSVVSFTITYPQPLPLGTLYWKYGPTPGGGGNSTPHWYVLPASISGAIATFTITDGGMGDDDLNANGSIVDQGGPGLPPPQIPVPTMNEWLLALLALVLLGFGIQRARNRRRAD